MRRGEHACRWVAGGTVVVLLTVFAMAVRSRVESNRASAAARFADYGEPIEVRAAAVRGVPVAVRLTDSTISTRGWRGVFDEWLTAGGEVLTFADVAPVPVQEPSGRSAAQARRRPDRGI